MRKETFGVTKDGKTASLYTLENRKGMKAVVTDFGAILVRLIVPDHAGKCADVVMGYDTLEEYFDNDSFFGAVIAPNANRIAGARFSIDGVEYQLDVNDGPNNLHSHKELGSHKRVWDAAEGDNSITFSLSMADGELGFPGNKKLQVTYTLTEDNELEAGVRRNQ